MNRPLTSQIVIDHFTKIIDRQNEKGWKKYGTTLDEADTKKYNWMLMALEEAADLQQYLVRQIMDLEEQLKTAQERNLPMKLNEYQALALRTHNPELSTPQALCNYALGCCGEAGETADMIKKGVFHGHEMNRHDIAKELGDQLWYIANLSKLIGFSLEDIATMNVTKLMKRYPDGFDSQKSIHRQESNES